MVNWKDWIGKKVFIRLKNGRTYAGSVLGVDDEAPIFLTLLDRYSQKVTFSIGEISVIQEETR